MPVDSSKSFAKQSPKYEPIPEGFYQVIIKDVEIKENIETKFGLKDKYVFTLKVLDTEHKGKIVFYRTSTAFSAGSGGKKNSSLYDLACAVLQERLDATKGIDVNTLIEGQLIVALSEVEVEGKKYNNVKTVMRAKDWLSYSEEDAIKTPNAEELEALL